MKSLNEVFWSLVLKLTQTDWLNTMGLNSRSVLLTLCPCLSFTLLDPFLIMHNTVNAAHCCGGEQGCRGANSIIKANTKVPFPGWAQWRCTYESDRSGKRRISDAISVELISCPFSPSKKTILLNLLFIVLMHDQLNCRRVKLLFPWKSSPDTWNKSDLTRQWLTLSSHPDF